MTWLFIAAAVCAIGALFVWLYFKARAAIRSALWR